MPTKTDPATVPPLTDAEVATMIRESFREQHCLSSFDMNATDAEFVAFYSSATARIRAAYALAASRVDTAEVERRAKYEALTKLSQDMGFPIRGHDVIWHRDRHYAPVANAPEGFTVRTEWDDKATIVNPAWCATEADIENAKREAASKAFGVASDVAREYGKFSTAAAIDRAGYSYLARVYPARDRVTPEEVAYACSRHGYEATDLRALDILRRLARECLASRVEGQP